MLGAMLLTWANVHFYQELMARARDGDRAPAPSRPSPRMCSPLCQ